ncbi:MAG: KH domain-containing protein [Coprothermobacterota bacterium]|nr:KH domain-containing protein [Chloroflexota bacterium]MCX5975446.1 KH domain-containing protein [Coprothermobacterota bacterium]
MKELVEYIVKNLVDHPEQVEIVEAKDEQGNLVLQILAAREDVGKVIGKNGRVIKAIRTLLKNQAARNNILANVTIE